MAEGMHGDALPGDGHTTHIAADGEDGMAAIPLSSPSPPPPSNLRLNAPSVNRDVACDRGEEEQQIPHVGAVDIEVPNEDVVGKYVEMAPKVGMTFDCEEKAYEMYNTYAGFVGFSVRKSRTKRRKSDDSLCQKYFVCSGEGHRKNKASQKDITRTGCDAHVHFSISKETGHIANFFWADGQSIMDCKCFGDAVSFDTTFQTNKFEMPFALILGTNHHKQTIIFGCALMFNETIPSFVWLFESFLQAMSGKQPSTIFTDQDAAMAAAIAHVLPNTAHRLCLWHIGQNAVKHLGPIIKAAEDEAQEKSGLGGFQKLYLRRQSRDLLHREMA